MDIKKLKSGIQKSLTQKTKEQKVGIIIFISVLILLIAGNIVNHKRLKSSGIKGLISAVTAPDSLPLIRFKNTSYYFDTIYCGDTVRIDFPFKNKGREELVIKDVITTCGCTVGYYTKDSIVLGEEGIVSVLFDSKNKSGKVDSDISVMSNASNNDVFLRVYGFVKERE